MFKKYKEPTFPYILNRLITFKILDLYLIIILEFFCLYLSLNIVESILARYLILIPVILLPILTVDFCGIKFTIEERSSKLSYINFVPIYRTFNKNYCKKVNRIVSDNSEQIDDNRDLINSYIIKRIRTSIYILYAFQVVLLICILISYPIHKTSLLSLIFIPLIAHIIGYSFKIIASPLEFKDKDILDKVINDKAKGILSEDYKEEYINLSDIDKYRLKIIRILKSIAKSIAYLQDNKYTKEAKIIQKITNNLVKTIERFRQQDKDGNEYYNIDYSILNDIIQMMETFNSSITELISNPTNNMESNLQKIKEEVEGFLDNTNRIIDNYYENDISRLKDRLKIELDVYGR